MRLRFLVMFSVLSGTTFWASQAPAQILERIVASIAADYRERNAWPEPYVGPDRQAVADPFAIMVRNGWRAQNMLADVHFKEKGELNEAGRSVIRSVVYDVSSQYRTIFIRRSYQREDMTARIAAIEKYVAALQPEAGPPPIQETNADLPTYLHGWPTKSVTRDFQIKPPDGIYLAPPSSTLPSDSK
jgi:hypothetical protein